MKIHASGEDYLEAVLVLQKNHGAVRSIDVAPVSYTHLDVYKRQAVKDWQGRFKSASLNYQGDSP